MGEHQPRRIGAAGEEHRLAEGENAEEAPQQIDGERHRRIEQRAGEHIYRIGVEHSGPGDDRRECEKGDDEDEGEAARFSHGRTPADAGAE